MTRFPENYLRSNRNLAVGDVITEIRFHPFIKGKDYASMEWDHHQEILCFQVVEVFRAEYRCRYIGSDNAREFYWPFWDKQPNYGFMENGATSVRYCASESEKNAGGSLCSGNSD